MRTIFCILKNPMFWILALATKSLPFPAETVLINGWFSSFGLKNARMSINFSFGNSSASASPSMLFPVPGSPINRTCLLCSDAFLIMAQASSCPMTWSMIFSGTFSSSVVLKSSSFAIPRFVDRKSLYKVCGLKARIRGTYRLTVVTFQ